MQRRQEMGITVEKLERAAALLDGCEPCYLWPRFAVAPPTTGERLEMFRIDENFIVSGPVVVSKT